METYVNIGNEKACLFVVMSQRLLKELSIHPLLYHAVEEALISAQSGYFSAGILVWYQLLVVLSANTPGDAQPRHLVAHEILKTQPTREQYDGLLKRLKEEAKNCHNKELAKSGDPAAYQAGLNQGWREFIVGLFPELNALAN